MSSSDEGPETVSASTGRDIALQRLREEEAAGRKQREIVKEKRRAAAEV